MLFFFFFLIGVGNLPVFIYFLYCKIIMIDEKLPRIFTLL